MQILRFKDLKRLGVVTDRMSLRRRILADGFPPGILLGPNSIGWNSDEVDAWLTARPRRLPRTRDAAQPAQSATEQAIQPSRAPRTRKRSAERHMEAM
ncbi:MAG: AlpA family phage regulatory protein [Pseudomonadota bacterium]